MPANRECGAQSLSDSRLCLHAISRRAQIHEPEAAPIVAEKVRLAANGQARLVGTRRPRQRFESAFPTAHTQGDDIDDALRNAPEVIELELRYLAEKSLPIPPSGVGYPHRARERRGARSAA